MISDAITTRPAILESARVIESILTAAGYSVEFRPAATTNSVYLGFYHPRRASLDIRVSDHPKPGFQRMRARPGYIETYPLTEAQARKRLRNYL